MNPQMILMYVQLAEYLIARGVALGHRMKELGQQEGITPEQWEQTKASANTSIYEALEEAGVHVEGQDNGGENPPVPEPEQPEPEPSTKYGVVLEAEPSDADYENGDSVFFSENAQRWMVVRAGEPTNIGFGDWKVVRTITK